MATLNQNQSPSKVRPEVEAAPRGVCPSERSFYHPTLLSMTEAGTPQLRHLCRRQVKFIADFCFLKLITLLCVVAAYQLSAICPLRLFNSPVAYFLSILQTPS